MADFRSVLEGLKPEHKFTDKVPAELCALTKSLSDLGLRPDLDAYWDADYLMHRFIEKWENTHDESCRDQNGYPRDVFDQVGITIKMKYAWEYLSLGIFGKCNVAHELILETANDLQCSIFLSGEGFSKQALQILRNFCESCVGTIYFHKDRCEFDEWIADSENYHFPGYRKMTDKLNGQGVLSGYEKGFLDNRYSELNNSVHNKRRRLNMSFPNMKGNTVSSGTQDLSEWSIEVKKTVGFMMELYVRLWTGNYWRALVAHS